MPNIQDWAIDVTPGQAPTMPPSHTPSNDSDTLLSPSLCPSSSQLAAAATSDTDSCVDSIVRLYFPYSSCCWRFLFFKDLDCISSDDDGIIAAAEAVMNEAQETVALLEHQTMVAENAYTQMIVAADSFRTYALRARRELEEASLKLYKYKNISHINPFSVIERLHYYSSTGVNPSDAPFSHTHVPLPSELSLFPE